jgi:hypothetical protein
VYVVDGSGPMVSSLDLVKEEVKRSIGRLSPSQRFGVVVFGRIESAGSAGGRSGRDAGAPYEWFMPTLVRATPQAKVRLSAWLAGVKPSGRSNPLEGLRAAIGLRPDAVFLLSRSIERTGGGVWDQGKDKTMEELDRLNALEPGARRRPTVIKTIQFLDEDPSGIMQAIGQLHGGAGGSGGGEGASYTVIRRGADLAEKDAK